ncbi:germinal center-associated signaling and motility protein [Ochotona curzoniae]|uniref:germinal center-associated signaling and motility protein n=1 Tax=Ochotona curzoniae TaxID=130825 RepID=UPI001B35092F|nr:germinal center-associated signaling and motility protein [Ochotona curzoniae]
MGNFPQRESRWQQDTQEMPWNLKIQNVKQRASRCWNRHFNEGCFCLPWKTISLFKARRDSHKENEGMSSAPSQENAEQHYSEELCYILINHRVFGERPASSSTEEYYENVSQKPAKPCEFSEGTETEYSLLRVAPTPRPPPSPEDEYELLVPSRNFSHFPQQPHSCRVPLEVSFSCSG